MTAHAEPLRGRTGLLSSPQSDPGVAWGEPAPVGLLALGAVAARAGVRTTGSTIGGKDPVRWTGTRQQFLGSALFIPKKFPIGAGQVRTKDGLIGRIRPIGGKLELIVTSYKMRRSLEGFAMLLKNAGFLQAFDHAYAPAVRAYWNLLEFIRWERRPDERTEATTVCPLWLARYRDAVPTATVLEALRVDRAAVAQLDLLSNSEKAARDRLLGLMEHEIEQLADTLEQTAQQVPVNEQPSADPTWSEDASGERADATDEGQENDDSAETPSDRAIRIARRRCELVADGVRGWAKQIALEEAQRNGSDPLTSDRIRQLARRGGKLLYTPRDPWPRY